MSEKNINNLLKEKIDKLINRFNEQKGIIDAYILKERGWKKDKINHKREIEKLQTIIESIKKGNNGI